MIKTAAQYHDFSSYDRQKMEGHALDWQNQPWVYKEYPGIDPIPLPKDVRLPEEKLSSLVKKADVKDLVRPLDLADLSLILLLTTTLTAKTRHGGTDFFYRSVPSAGALYPTEIYVAARAIKGLNDGLYHFGILHHDLTLLRDGDLSSHIVPLTKPEANRAPRLTFFMTAIFFRSAWKYRNRAYRYHLLDTGHQAEHLMLALKAVQCPFSLIYDFDDAKVNHLLGLDESREVTLAVGQVLGDEPVPIKSSGDIHDLPEEMKRASRVSEKEIKYSAIDEFHEAGTEPVDATIEIPEMIHEIGITPDTWTEIPSSVPWPEAMKHGDTMFHRRSRRNFVKTPIGKDVMEALLDSLCHSDSSSLTPETNYDRSICAGFLVEYAEEPAPGFYLLETSKRAYGQVSSGSFTQMAAHICLDQAWLAQTAVHFLFFSNPDLLDRTSGARGYRYAMLTAGRMGERLYLAATALGLGCCGIGAFYDWEAAELLGLNPESRLLYLVAVGPVKKQINKDE
jgi:SagB-type dehydrogenase family enzyme